MMRPVFRKSMGDVFRGVFPAPFSPLNLFSAGSVGGWYDPADLSTLFQDSAGTTPVTEAGQPVGLVQDKSGGGYNAVQAISAERPTYAIVPKSGRRNLAVSTELFDNASWVKFSSGTGSNPVVTDDFADGPLPNTRASRIVFDLGGGTTAADISQIRNATPYTVAEYTPSFWLRSNTGSDYDIIFTIGNSQAGEVTVTSTWQRLSLTFTPGAANILGAGLRTRGSAGHANVTDILVYGAQFELGDAATAYQRVKSEFDVFEAGVPSLSYFARTDVAQSLNATFPDLGANATVATATESNVAISGGQTIGAGSYDVLQGSQTFGHVVINRPLRLSETTSVRQYLKGNAP